MNPIVKAYKKLNALMGTKYLEPVKKLLMQGASPKAIALGIAAAVVLGLFPVIGTTTILCTAAALLFRLNLPLMQIVNYSIFPLQIVVIVPLMKLGEVIFGIEKLNYTAAEIANLFGEDMINAVELLWNVIIQAIGAWLIIAPVAVFIVFRLLLPVIRKINSGIKSAPQK